MQGYAPLRAPGQRSCKQHVSQALQSWDKGGDKCHLLLVALSGRGMGRRTLIFFSWEDIERKGNKPHPTN